MPQRPRRRPCDIPQRTVRTPWRSACNGRCCAFHIPRRRRRTLRRRVRTARRRPASRDSETRRRPGTAPRNRGTTWRTRPAHGRRYRHRRSVRTLAHICSTRRYKLSWCHEPFRSISLACDAGDCDSPGAPRPTRAASPRNPNEKKPTWSNTLRALNHVGLLCNWPPGEPGCLLSSRPTTCILFLRGSPSLPHRSTIQRFISRAAGPQPVKLLRARQPHAPCSWNQMRQGIQSFPRIPFLREFRERAWKTAVFARPYGGFCQSTRCHGSLMQSVVPPACSLALLRNALALLIIGRGTDISPSNVDSVSRGRSWTAAFHSTRTATALRRGSRTPDSQPRGARSNSPGPLSR